MFTAQLIVGGSVAAEAAHASEADAFAWLLDRTEEHRVAGTIVGELTGSANGVRIFTTNRTNGQRETVYQRGSGPTIGRRGFRRPPAHRPNTPDEEARAVAEIAEEGIAAFECQDDAIIAAAPLIAANWQVHALYIGRWDRWIIERSRKSWGYRKAAVRVMASEIGKAA